MKRKTNLFYIGDDESKFLTFSNYTEALTGNFLSTETKLYPSKFLCLQIDGLNISTKDSFIKYLCQYYENKLAFFRDIFSDKTTKTGIHPLNYLFSCINKWAHDVDINLNKNNLGFTISCVSSISETNYEGIYNDVICIIDNSSKHTIGELTTNTELLSSHKTYSWSTLYGWDSYTTMPSIYNNLSPKFDNDADKKYYTNDEYKTLSISETTGDISFNVVIPLFDIVNPSDVDDDYAITTDTLNISSSTINVPIGIWFAEDNITLTRDSSGYQPSWSLSIAMQFKPFPYSKELPTELSNQQIDTSFTTFSRILYKQNELLNNINNFQTQINKLSYTINSLTAKVNSMRSSYYIDDVHKEIILLKNDFSKQINEINTNINSYMSELNWTVN